MGRGTILLAILQTLLVASTCNNLTTLNSTPTVQLKHYSDVLANRSSNPNLVYHIVPHTHDDAGWLKTFDEYYYGLKSDNYNIECVECILNETYSILSSGKHRVFSYVEMSFFEKWYSNLTHERQQGVKDFVKNKQLFFPNAGWVMNDEACAYYEDIIEQFTLGHRFVYQEFNFTPSVGWSVDPFGHSSTHAHLLAQMGMNLAFFDRIHYSDQRKRRAENNTEFYWMPYEDFPEWGLVGRNNLLFYGGLSAEVGYQFKTISWASFDKKTNSPAQALYWLNDQADYYATDQVFFHIGSDFTFSKKGTELYEDIEKFVVEVNAVVENSTGVAILSAPDVYAEQWYLDYARYPNIRLTIKKDDFFPYADAQDGANYWTGYFSSRPTLKRKISESSWFLQTARKMAFGGGLVQALGQKAATLKAFWELSDRAINKLERALAIAQHHDAVTGTAKKHVNLDYIKMLNDGQKEAWEIMKLAGDSALASRLKPSAVSELKKLVSNAPSKNSEANRTLLKYFTCKDNTSSIECPFLTDTLSEISNTSLLLQIYNPGPNKYAAHRVKVPHSDIEVLNISFKPCDYDIICSEDIYTDSDLPDCDVYISDFFPSYETRYYIIRRSIKPNSTNAMKNIIPSKTKDGDSSVALPFDSYFNVHEDNKTYSYNFCNSKGLCVQDKFRLEYKYYEHARVADQGGAYVMRVDSTTKFPIASAIEFSVFQGQYVTIIQLTPQNFDLFGFETVLVLRSFNLDNKGVFKTDSNGLKLENRILNHIDGELPEETGHTVEANYYPVTAAIVLEDLTSNRTLRSQGASSLNKGEVELLIHRKASKDDRKGLVELMAETESVYSYREQKSFEINERVRCIHHYQISNSEIKNQVRKRQIDRDTALFTTYAEIPNSILSNNLFEAPIEFNNKEDAFPSSIKLSIRAYSQNEIILRLVNLDDRRTVNVSLLDNNGYLRPLSHFSGMRVLVNASQLQDVSLNTIREKKQVLEERFKIRERGEINVDSLIIQNFSNFQMRPLEIVTIKIVNPTFEKAIASVFSQVAGSIYYWDDETTGWEHNKVVDEEEVIASSWKFDFNPPGSVVKKPDTNDKVKIPDTIKKYAIFVAMFFLGVLALCCLLKCLSKRKPEQHKPMELVNECTTPKNETSIVVDRFENENSIDA